MVAEPGVVVRDAGVSGKVGRLNDVGDGIVVRTGNVVVPREIGKGGVVSGEVGEGVEESVGAGDNAVGGDAWTLDGIANEFIEFYTKLIGTEDREVHGSTVDELRDLLKYSLLADALLALCKDASNDEIRAALFKMGKDKSPGPDGYTTGFFQTA
ncbi:hypothetical protein V6N11_047680 [Hibiscus sabdariffa]|uniref:Uncharacterized protein n=2 Tax=Hibiscus sabdariffa TaxID=183260 RepID=A0ABR2BAC1_9ROSI